MGFGKCTGGGYLDRRGPARKEPQEPVVRKEGRKEGGKEGGRMKRSDGTGTWERPQRGGNESERPCRRLGAGGWVAIVTTGGGGTSGITCASRAQ